MTAWWEHHTSSHCCLHFMSFAKYTFKLKSKLWRCRCSHMPTLITSQFSLHNCSTCVFVCVRVFYRTTPHTLCPQRTSMPACRPCPASTAALLAAHPSSPHPTLHPSTPQRELWVRYAMSHLPQKKQIQIAKAHTSKIHQMLGRLFWSWWLYPGFLHRKLFWASGSS